MDIIQYKCPFFPPKHNTYNVISMARILFFFTPFVYTLLIYVQPCMIVWKHFKQTSWTLKKNLWDSEIFLLYFFFPRLGFTHPHFHIPHTIYVFVCMILYMYIFKGYTNVFVYIRLCVSKMVLKTLCYMLCL